MVTSFTHVHIFITLCCLIGLILFIYCLVSGWWKRLLLVRLNGDVNHMNDVINHLSPYCKIRLFGYLFLCVSRQQEESSPVLFCPCTTIKFTGWNQFTGSDQAFSDSNNASEHPITKQPFNSSCPICLEDYRIDESIVLLTCKHGFHQHCIKRALSQKATCPYCKSNKAMTTLQPGERTPLLRTVVLQTEQNSC